jgi:triosephosphate isomerase (TIM)
MSALIIAANWKMNKDLSEGQRFLEALAPQLSNSRHQLVIFPPAVLVKPISDQILRLGLQQKIWVGLQNVSEQKSGAFTGEISVEQGVSVGAQIFLVGHSERRQVYGETDETVQRKVHRVLSAGQKVMLCVGETLSEREAGQTMAVVERQLRAALGDGPQTVGSDHAGKIFVAYEPVWAIGTGQVATPEQAEEVHQFILGTLGKIFGPAVGPILYGGSVKSDNAPILAKQPSIGGFLIGGASLDPSEFGKISKL